ncbi:MAG TPA: zf-HC2 domain-containing protein [Caulifigura sp.]|jgi:hypothetical protein|nr:zf-HC2 domain-containing protein [Caulifigura sp.]
MSRDFDELLSAYLDGEVTPEERAAVERRLEQSPAMRETLDELSEVGELVRSLPRARAPEDLPNRVVAAISNRPLAGKAAAAGSARWLRAWPLWAAGTVLAAGVAIVVMLPERGGPKVAHNAAPATADFSLAGSTDRKLAEGRSGAALDVSEDRYANSSAMELKAESPVELLTERIQKLNRPPEPGDVLDILQRNANQTRIQRFYVVDTQETADSLKHILADNQLDIVVTETPKPATSRAKSVAQDTMYWYLEGPSGQVDNALEKIRTLNTVNGVQDEGLLAQDSETPMPADFGSRAAPAESVATQLRDEAAIVETRSAAGSLGAKAESSAAIGREAAPQLPAVSTAPAPAPPAPIAVTSAPAPADKQQPGSAAGTPSLFNKEQVTKSMAADRPADPESKSGLARENFDSAVANPVAQSNARGVSAQLDSKSLPAVEDMLRNRSAGNAYPQRGMNQLQQNVQPRFSSPTQSAEKQRAVTEAERLNEPKAKDNVELRQQTPDVGRDVMFRRNAQASGGARGAVMNAAADMTHVLIILQNGAPAPAATPAAPPPAPALKASN